MSSVLRRPNEDLNLFVSSSTVSGTTLTAGSSGSFVKHPGLVQITHIGPEDVPVLLKWVGSVGKMVSDKVMVRCVTSWVKAVTVASKSSEGSGVENVATSDVKNEDPFRNIESLCGYNVDSHFIWTANTYVSRNLRRRSKTLWWVTR
ncbi:hypothetical protein BJV78DRAFT_1151364 [Lactifluus subvellereus]|nr:hypothetical protein BJV78DRAFT_1151364 [Lactifluus subvellereus]